MRQMDKPVSPLDGPEAVIHYGSPEFTILRAGRYVRCAVTGASIPLPKLKYWSAELQEAYADAAAALTRFQSLQRAKDAGA